VSSPDLLQRFLRLTEIARDLTSTINIDVLLSHIVAVAAEISQAEEASILLYDETCQQLFFQTATNISQQPQMQGMPVPVEGSLAGWVFSHRQAVNVSDARNDSRHFEGIDQAIQFSTGSLVGFPLIAKDKVIGVLEVINKREGDFNRDDMQLLTALAAQAAVAIENARLFHQSDLIAEMVHELRTPLASLSAAAYLLQHSQISATQRSDLAKIIYGETQRLNEMSSAFLDLARLESGRAIFNLEFFDIPPLLKESLDIMQSRAQESQVKLMIGPHPILPPIQADRVKLKQVLLNLLSNAIKYNRPGGSVNLIATVTDQEIAIAVSDTGVGISPESMPHLFEKFYRVKCDESTISGTGLGLSICQRIILSHHGRIEVTSEPDKGSTFTVYLPVKQ
jgi:signal transduction histidine kinase